MDKSKPMTKVENPEEKTPDEVPVSAEYQAQERKVAEEKANYDSGQVLKTQNVYWTAAKKFRLGGWIPEQRDLSGRTMRQEASLDWEENLRATSDPKEIEFIENSDAFKNGHIHKAKSIEEARRLVRERQVLRQGQRVRIDEYNINQGEIQIKD
jgi:hypothetical protein